MGHLSQVNNPVIPISAREASLRRKVRRQLHSLGFHKSGDGTLEMDGYGKGLVRSLHSPQRTDRLAANTDFLARRADKLLPHFASGQEVEPAAIRPEPRPVYTPEPGRRTCFA